MQIRAEQVVVVVVVVGRRVVVVVVVVLRGVVVVVTVVVVVVEVVVDFAVVVVVVVVDDAFDDTELGVVVAPADCEAGGIGSTAPSSVGSRSGGASSPSRPTAKIVHTIAPTRAPAASRPCPLCRGDPMGVLRVCQRPL
jgi:hypothetical protein